MSNRHPAGIGEQNRHVLDTTSDAYKAALDLADRGFTIVGIQIGDRYPVVRIRGERRCDQLHGATKKITGNGGSREEILASKHKGVQIEWRAYQ